MSIFLDGISAQFYRGIGTKTQYISPFRKINFFIGANNAGKSIVLNLISDHAPGAKTSKGDFELSASEMHRGGGSGTFSISRGFPNEAVNQKFCERLGRKGQLTYNDAKVFEAVKSSFIAKLCKDGFLWIKYRKTGSVLEAYETHDIEQLRNLIDDEHWRFVYKMLSNRSGGDVSQHWIPETMSALAQLFSSNLPDCHLIPAKRQIGGKDEDFRDLSGRGLIDHLASLQNPGFERQDKKLEFRKINSFLKEVTGKSEAELEVPSDREHLLVNMDKKVLPLSALGTGIHETVLIASFCTIHKKKILCVEEPEIHLHPVLQRKLIRYLAEKTDNQYFIATHSATLIDYKGASIFHVLNDGSQTYIRHIISDNERYDLLEELGYKASDILQTNFIIWVEGPSDRIYLRHWISEKDPELIEGIHYTIMFYGGGLIRHLSAAEEGSEDAIEDFIKILKLNRNCAIIMDSDREKDGDSLKKNADRISKEMAKSGRIAWITAGREIENYIDHDRLQSALKECHPRAYLKPHKAGQFDHAFYFYTENKKTGRSETYKNGDKVGAATKVCEEPANFNILDLDDRVSEIVECIRKANEG